MVPILALQCLLAFKLGCIFTHNLGVAIQHALDVAEEDIHGALRLILKPVLFVK